MTNTLPVMQGMAVGVDATEFADCMDTRPPREPSRAARAEPAGLAPSARLIVVLERHRLTAGGRRLVLDALDEVIVGRRDPGPIERAGRHATVVAGDSETSRRHLALRRTSAGWRVEDLGSRNGTLVNGEQVEHAALADGDLIEAGGAVLVFRIGRDRPGDEHDRDSEPAALAPSVFRTLNHSLEARLGQIRRIAPSRIPVLVRGETGTGKELLARAIHEASGRTGPLVAVNCGALPRDLIESELFGHRRGAFSGATEHRDGLFLRAHKGTLFLDEIAELPADSQAALLRALQEGEIRPLGASTATMVDVRVVAATHQDLVQRISAGRFRQDLYARVAGFEVTMPALRERREDLGSLIAAILPTVTPHPERFTLHRDAACALLRYAWPHNIRELEHALRSAVTLCEDGKIRLEHLPEAIVNDPAVNRPALSARDAALRERIVELLAAADGNVAAVARAMGRAPIQIRRWCRRLRIDLEPFRRCGSEQGGAGLGTG